MFGKFRPGGSVNNIIKVIVRAGVCRLLLYMTNLLELFHVRRKSKSETDKQKAQRRRDDDDLQRTIELSKTEALALQEERKQMEEVKIA